MLTSSCSPKVHWLPLLSTLWSFCQAATPLPDPPSLQGVVIGSGRAGGSLTVDGSEIRLTARGASIGGRADQGYFAYQDFGTNDFDVQVRVSGLDATGLWAKAGLLLRDGTNTAGPMAGIFTTPTASGVVFQSRNVDGASAVNSGFFPANLPYGWLRLQRSNDVVTGLAGYDGRRWTVVGRNTVTLTNGLVGVAATSHHTNRFTTATFSDFANSTGEPVTNFRTDREPLGPSSRRTALVVSEINYRPATPTDNTLLDPTQFIELYNSDFSAKNLAGHRLTAGPLQYTFPANTVLAAGAFIVVAQDPNVLRERHPSVTPTSIRGPWTGDFSGDQTVRLFGPNGSLLLEVPLRGGSPWPVAANGYGHSMILARPSYGEGDPRAWSASYLPGGSPGTGDPIILDSRDGLRINEVNRGRLPLQSSFIELFNSGAEVTRLEGLEISQFGAREPIRLPARSLVPGEFFSLPLPRSIGRDLQSPMFLRATASGRIIDAVEFAPVALTGSVGRDHPNHALLKSQSVPTPGAPNSAPTPSRIVISELMYHPITDRDDEQWLELWNAGAVPVSLADWVFTAGIQYQFPKNTVLAPNTRLVLARNVARLRATHTGLGNAVVLGDFNGRLSGGGERLTLRDADGGIVVDFAYGTGGAWPALADGGGSSLELRHPSLNPALGSSWAASDESKKAPWTRLETTGVLEGGQGTANDVRILLGGVGEALVDDVEVIPEGGTNLLSNPTFEITATGWSLTGTHDQSRHTTSEGFGGSSGSLRLKSSGRGDNGINSIRSPLKTAIRAGTNVTLRLRARWLAGSPDILMRLKGNFLELPGTLTLPDNLGTPGAANSRAEAAPKPALFELAHFPILPREGEPVRVTVRSHNLLGTNAPVLQYRADPGTVTNSVAMNDRGVDGDEVPNDGYFTATIPAPAGRGMIAFQANLQEGDSRAVQPGGPNDLNPREALVRWGEALTFGNLGTYRVWLSRANETRWTNRPRLHNGDIEGTFIYGTSRAIYDLGALYSGSPFVSPGYQGPAGVSLCGYVLHFPDDAAVLGETDFVLDWPIRDDSLQLEQRAYEFGADIGLPYLHRRFINLYVNSSKRSAVYEDTQQPGSAFLNNWFPDDSNGQLHKIEDWFEFSSGGDMEFNQDATLDEVLRSDGSKNRARYRWNWRKRAVKGSSHDYGPFFQLVDAAKPPADFIDFTRTAASEIDIDEWMGIFALEHAVGNWDSFGYSRGKNMFAYRPERGPWKLLIWDIDFVMSAGGNGPQNGLFDTIDSTISKFYQHPPFQRAYWRAIKRLANGPMVPARFEARVAEVRQGLVDNGVNSQSAAGTAAQTYVRNQQAYLLQQLSQVDSAFQLTDGVNARRTNADPVQVISGNGPVEMTAVKINGTPVPVTWLNPVTWTAVWTVNPGRTGLRIEPIDTTGRSVGTAANLTVQMTAEPQALGDRVVFNELLLQPRNSGGAFLELHNPSTSQSADLSGLQLAGAMSYEFPAGTVLAPGSFLVLTETVPGFQAEFGRFSRPATTLPTPLPKDHGTLALIRPANGTNAAFTLTAVTYRNSGPWPNPAPGVSLQLQDPSRSEDDRVGNWSFYRPKTNASSWKDFSVTGPAVGTNLLLYVTSFPPAVAPLDVAGRWQGVLSAFDNFTFTAEFVRNADGVLTGQLFFDTVPGDPDAPGSTLGGITTTNGAVTFTWQDIAGTFTGRFVTNAPRVTGTFRFSNGTSPFSLTRVTPGGSVYLDDLVLSAAGNDTNLLNDGSFSQPLGSAWMTNGAHAASSVVVTTNPVTGKTDQSLRLRTTGAGGYGTTSNALIQPVGSVVPGQSYTLRGRYLSESAQSFYAGLEGGSGFSPDLRPRDAVSPDATPGRINSVRAELPPFPLVWLNEIQPEVLGGAPGPALEIHNSGPNAQALAGFFLSRDPATPEQWAFPTNVTVPARGFVVVELNGAAGGGLPGSLQANFRPTATNGVVVLSQRRLGEIVAIDFLRYENVLAGQSFGHLPDAWVHADQVLLRESSLGDSNSGGLLPVRINEWMASNSGFLRDPADQDADDWIELYNPNPTAVDLTGAFLTDDLTQPNKYRIPGGYPIPGGGYLLVWADDELGQNNPTNKDLHVAFKLSAGGEAIGLFDRQSRLLDSVVFGPQQSDLSQGRRVDGSAGTNYVFFASPTPGGANRLTAPAPLQITQVILERDGTTRVRFRSEIGRRYCLCTRHDLAGAAWQPVGIVVVSEATDSVLVLPDTGTPECFIRVQEVR